MMSLCTDRHSTAGAVERVNKVIKLKKIRKIKLPDTIIVGSALTLGYTLFTIEGLSVRCFESVAH